MVNTSIRNSKEIMTAIWCMLRLCPSWCTKLGTKAPTFYIALVVNILMLPISAWFSMSAAQAAPLLFNEQLIIEALLLGAMTALLFLFSVLRKRVKRFYVVYAGVTYSTVVVGLVLAAVQALLVLYGSSLYGQNAPMLAHILLIASLVWMVVLISFIFKAGLEVGAASSVIMTSFLLFILITGRQLLEIMMLNY